MEIERKRPVAGIGYGQKGFWGNEHFSSVALAEEAFEKRCREMRNEIPVQFGKLAWKHGSIEMPIVGGTLIKGSRFVGKLKSGKPGKIVHTVHLYGIDDKLADKFMADPWYSVRR